MTRRPEQPGVVQLQEGAAVQRHHGETVAGLDAELLAERVGQPQHPRSACSPYAS